MFEERDGPVDTVIQMTRAQRARARAGKIAIAACALAILAFPGSAAARAGSAKAGSLSPRLAALAKPALRAASPAQQAIALSLGGGSGGLARDGAQVLAEVHLDGDVGDATRRLRDAGARVLGVSNRYDILTVAVAPVDLRAVAAVPGVASVSEALAPIVSGADCGGAVRSEGDQQLNVATARSAFGVDGSGVDVGILSDSFDRNGKASTHAAGDVASGDLPGSGSPCGSTTAVGVLDDTDTGGADEGRAMAQIVHDLAPGANLSFASATAHNSQFLFASAIRALRSAGADVIVDDVFYPDEPVFQEGPVAVAVREVTASGAAYFSAAGNDNLIDEEGHDIGSWEAPEFRDAGACPPELEAAVGVSSCMNFDPSGSDDTFGITVKGFATLRVDLQWAEPWLGVETDLDAYLLDAAGKPLEVKVNEEDFLVGSADDNPESGEPLEYFTWKNTSSEPVDVQLAIDRCAAACNPAASESANPRLKVTLLQNGSGVSAFEYPESTGGDVVGPTIFGHAGSPAAVGVGAVPFNDSAEPEEYSSRGPLTHYFEPFNEDTPAAPVPPQQIAKPDLVATDGGANTFFGPFVLGARRFFGTSAAAPHAAAVAALMKQANPSLSFAQMRSVMAATARPVGAFGPNAVGAGLVDAYGALSDVALPPSVTITERPPALGKDRQPRIGFSANRPVAFSCSLDGGALAPCSSPFVPTAPLADGEHGFVVRGVDAAGRSGSSELVSFKIDTRRPRTFFRKHPPKVLRTHKRVARAVFRFGSNEPGVSFVCKIDAGFLRFCNQRLVRRFSVGKHVVSVKARDPVGNVDRTPAVFRFEVKRVR